MVYIAVVVSSIVAAALVFRFLSLVSKHRNRRTAAEVAEAIEKHIEGGQGPWDWDDFTSVPIADNRLDAIRLRCIELDHAPPSERVQELKKVVGDLRKQPPA